MIFIESVMTRRKSTSACTPFILKSAVRDLCADNHSSRVHKYVRAKEVEVE